MRRRTGKKKLTYEDVQFEMRRDDWSAFGSWIIITLQLVSFKSSCRSGSSRGVEVEGGETTNHHHDPTIIIVIKPPFYFCTIFT